MSNAWDSEWFTPPEVSKEEAIRLLGDGEAMRQHVIRRSRLPFQEVLARLLSAEPSKDEVQALARANPDKWAKMVRDMASLSGYKDGIEIEANINMTVNDMSDAELMVQFDQLQGQLAKLAEDTGIEDGEFYEVPALEDLNAEATKAKVAADLPDFLK